MLRLVGYIALVVLIFLLCYRMIRRSMATDREQAKLDAIEYARLKLEKRKEADEKQAELDKKILEFKRIRQK